MPRFRITRSIATRDVSGIRAVCDGCDPSRPCDEHNERAALWLVTAGAFELRDTAGRHVIDPSQAIVLPRHHAYQIRHPAGPDTCLSLRGPLIDDLAGEGARLVAIAPQQIAQILDGLAGDDDLAVAEALSQLAPAGHGDASGSGGRGPSGGARTAAPDRDLSAAIAHVLRARHAEPSSLGEIAAAAGYSVFHACRVFRATTGNTIHGFRRELRLRHALARILDGDEPLTTVALATGFASQSHLTNRFRARFGVTPARARTREGRRRLAARID